MPKDIADQIVDRADGVPLFIEELTKIVVESGIVADAGDHYSITGSVAPLAIPTTLHASLLARLDRLAPVRGSSDRGSTRSSILSRTDCSRDYHPAEPTR
jgi:predicted ATPase